MSGRAGDAVPADGRALVLYDDRCNLCCRSVEFLRRRDRHGRFRYAPLPVDGPGAQAAHGPPGSLELVDERGRHLRSDAVLRVLAGLGAPWSWLGVLAVVPRPVRDRAYDFVARRRYRWFGTRDGR